MPIKIVIGIFVFFILSGSAGTAGEPKNLVPDGGFEEVNEIIISSSQPWFTRVESGIELTREGPFVFIPSNFSGSAGFKKLKVIEGAAGKEVHTGKRAISLEGSFYMGAGCKAETGDVFIARFYAKGKGTARVILYLANKEGKYFDQTVPKPAPVDSEKWILIEQRLETVNKPDLAKIWPRLAVTGEVYIDNIVLIKETQ